MPQVGKFQLRIGLVLYGGASLAVYMSGMTQELLALVRAGQARKVLANPGDFAELVPWAERERDGNQYVDLLQQADIDVVIDVIAGTSAGGLNGLMLAKALAAGTPELGPVTDSLWREKADMEKLASADADPASVLSGAYLETELNNMMKRVQQRQNPHLAALVKILDLFITATDIRGHRWTRWDRFNQKLEGSSHKYLFHLMKRQPQGNHRGYHRNDFIAGPNSDQAQVDAVLTKIGRATSAFPGVFPPILITPAEAAAAGVNVLNDVDPAYADGIWFSDGGMLVNAPFEPVLDTIFERGANQAVKRALVFLEPDPLVDDVTDAAAARARAKAKSAQAPGMVETALSAVTLPMDQDILDKLTRLEAENERRRRLAELLGGLDKMVASSAGDVLHPDFGALVGLSLPMSQVAATRDPAGTPAPGLQVGTYYQIRLNRLHQVLTQAFTRALAHLGLDEARAPKVAATLVEKLSPGKTVDVDNLMPVLEALEQLDAEFQARRLHFVLGRVHEHCCPGAAIRHPEALEEMLNRLWGALEDWNNALWVLGHAGKLGPQPDRWRIVCADLDKAMVAYADAVSHKQPAEGELAVAVALIKRYLNQVADAAQTLVNEAIELAEAALAVDHPAPAPLDAAALQRAYADFASVDMVLFPIQIGTGRSEWGEIGLYGFTPNAACSWVTKRSSEKLAGETLGHFGAFLDERWRTNDIMWGRLDAAEEIFTMVAREAGLIKKGELLTAPLQTALMARRRRILAGYPDLIDLEQLRILTQGGLPTVPAVPPSLTAGQRVQGAWDVLTKGQVAPALMGAGPAPAFSLDSVPDDVLRDYLMQTYKVGEEGLESLPPKKLAGEVLMMLDNTARALGKPAPSPLVARVQQSLVAVLRPLDWMARLVLLPKPGLAGQIQENLPPLMTLVGTALLVAAAMGAVKLSSSGIILMVALFAPMLLDLLLRPTAWKIALLGLPTLLTCLAAAAPKLANLAWLAWMKPVLTWLANHPALGQLWGAFLFVFVVAVVTWWSGARWRRHLQKLKAEAGA